MFRKIGILLLVAVVLPACASAGILHHGKKPKNPLANVDSKQPDKVLFDRAMDALKHGKYDIARLTLQTLINTYPDSEYVARAKLGIGDAWYAEGGTTALAQAEIEYKDFITFFPNMPEAAEAQLKVANIHYRQMEKPDRDYTHAKRAEDEYRQLILQFPDSTLVPQAQQRLREVQEVLAQREFTVGHFYYVRESWPAAIARLKTVVDTYPLFSQADEALYLIGDAYEKEIENARHAKFTNEAMRALLIAGFANRAVDAYSRIITRYPVTDRADDAKHRLKALGRPVPMPTPQMIAQNKAEENSRSETGRFGKIIGNFKHAPDVAQASKIGEPTMNDPSEASAVDMVKQATSDMRGDPGAGGSTLTIETIKPGEVPANQPVPKSSTGEAAPPPGASEATPVAPATNPDNSNPSAGESTIPELKPMESNAPQTAAPASPPSAQPVASGAPVTGTAPSSADQPSSASAPGNAQVNDAANPSPQASTQDQSQPQTTASDKQETSSSKKKKKKGLHKLIPF